MRLPMKLYYKTTRPFMIVPAALDYHSADGCIVHWPSQPIDFAPTDFVYVEVGKPSGVELAKTLANSRKTGVIATPHPDLLVDLFQTGCGEFRLALRIIGPRDFAGLNRCPYDGVEIPESLATHDVIHRIHHSGKEVYVRIPNRKIRPRRIIGLAHETVDALIIEGAEALSAVKLSAEVGA